MKLTLTVQEALERAKLARAMRKAMGMSTNDMALKLNVSSGHYSSLEHGREILSAARLSIIEEIFQAWRNQEITRLEQQIEYLKSLKVE